jgi:hypothetical protein
MGRKRHTAEQIIGKLRSAEIELAKGLGTAAGERSAGGFGAGSWTTAGSQRLCPERVA